MRQKWIVLSMLLMLLAACGAGIAHRVPTTPPQGITAKQADADVAECEKTVPPASSRLRELSEEIARNRTYAACMIARGHTAYVQVPVWRPSATFKNVAPFNVTTTRVREPSQIFADLAECSARTERDARPNPALTVLTWPSSPVDWDAVERVFGGCMGERGYSAKLWTPTH